MHLYKATSPCDFFKAFILKTVAANELLNVYKMWN